MTGLLLLQSQVPGSRFPLDVRMWRMWTQRHRAAKVPGLLRVVAMA